MRKFQITLGLILFTLISFSQEENKLHHSYDGLYFKENTTAYLFGNNVRLREQPSTESKELELLPVLKKIELLEKTAFTQNINGIDANWIKIKVENQIGYILDCFVSLSYVSTEKKAYVTRCRKQNDDFFVEMRIIDKNDSIENFIEKKFRMPHSSITIKTYGNRGLKGISNIMYIDYMAEACGVEGGGLYILLNDKNIIAELELNEISEAGLFWQSEEILFPEDDKNIDENSIKFIQEIGNVIDESSSWYEKKIIERQHRLIDIKLVPEFKSKNEN